MVSTPLHPIPLEFYWLGYRLDGRSPDTCQAQ